MAVEKLSIDFDGVMTNIYKLGSGLVLSEPTVATVGIDGKDEVKSFGLEARKLIGKTAENTKVVFPVFEGEIVNVKVAIGLLSGFLKKIGIYSKLIKVHAVMSVPCGATVEMLEKYREVAYGVGINKVYFIESPILCALGQRLPLNDFSPCFMVDMAGGTTNIAVLSLDGIIAGVSVNFGSNKICTDIIDFLANEKGIQIGLLTAERLRKEIGSLSEGDSLAAIVNGRDMQTGTPKSLSIRAMDIITPMKKYYDKIAELTLLLLKKLPPEVSAEIRHAGINICGIASDVYGLESYFSQKFDMKISIGENGDMASALGGGVAIGNDAILKKVAISFE